MHPLWLESESAENLGIVTVGLLKGPRHEHVSHVSEDQIQLMPVFRVLSFGLEICVGYTYLEQLLATIFQFTDSMPFQTTKP